MKSYAQQALIHEYFFVTSLQSMQKNLIVYNNCYIDHFSQICYTPVSGHTLDLVK